MKTISENTSIKKAYLERYSHDKLAKKLNDVTFEDLFRCLDNYQNVYEFIGIHDSIIRENLFSMLSEIMNVDYKVIYEQWMKAIN